MVRCVVLIRVVTSLSWTLRRAGSNLFGIQILKSKVDDEMVKKKMGQCLARAERGFIC